MNEEGILLPAPLTDDERMAQLEEKRAKRVAAKDAAAKKMRLLVLELEDKYSTTLGERGRDFEIVESAIGEAPIVLKRPTTIAVKRLSECKEEANEIEALNLIVAALVEPSEQEVRARAAKYAGIAVKCVNAITAMHDANEVAHAGK